MVQKRPFSGEESYDVSSKHPRQLEYSDQLVSFLEFVPAEDMTQQLNILGEGKGNFTKGNEKHVGGIITELPICSLKDVETSFPGCMSNVSWTSSSISEEDVGSEAPFHLLLSPEYHNPNRPVRTLVQPEEIYTSLLECCPRKLVPVGPDFQADLPEWDGKGTKNVSDGADGPEPLTPFHQPSAFRLCGHNDDENKLAGSYVIPMPELGSIAHNGDKVGDGRTDCCCEDSGSVRCVSRHIKEAREKLRRVVGPERFSELGFSDMGEVVADTWSLEEEQLFHEIVFSNPASSGKNFWDHLSMAFPSRTKKDIVSYYFNVFMLRKRAEQNRFDPMNIDSDDDEWQGSDDSGSDGVGTGEEDEDSEFPVSRDDPCHNEIQEDEFSHEYDDCIDRGCFNISTTSGGGHEFIFEPCDAKVWDHVGYLNYPKNEVEFLPTCSMIEEVFGVGAWNYKARDGDGF